MRTARPVGYRPESVVPRSVRPPSQTFDRYWVLRWADGIEGEVGPHVGKWVVRVDAAQIDQAWSVTCRALDRGELGQAAKCRTALPHPRFDSSEHTVICVYTRDARDIKERERVKTTLEALGFHRLHYTTDEATLQDWKRPPTRRQV